MKKLILSAFLSLAFCFASSVLAFADETPPPVPVETQYYAVINGAQSGPYSVSQLQEMLNRAEISPSTQVWTQGMDGWTALSNVAELQQHDNNSQNIDDSELTDKEKKYANKLGDIITNKYAMQKKFKGGLGGGIALAVVSSVCLPVGSGLLGSGIYYLINNLKEGDMITALGGVFFVAALITGSLCAVPFCYAGRVANIYRKINKEKLFSALSRTGIGVGYDAQNKKTNVMIAIKL